MGLRQTLKALSDPTRRMIRKPAWVLTLEGNILTISGRNAVGTDAIYEQLQNHIAQ